MEKGIEDTKDLECLQDEEECQRLMDKVILSLDGALSHDEEMELVEKIQQYPCCLERMNIARAYKVFICHKVQKMNVPVSLIDSIRQRISNRNL